ncbi:MAG TPA: SxtJ family membrane protein [Bacteroidota bacterium]|nr:SxtJ family membrane protein [Bacteroidota bacterium]
MTDNIDASPKALRNFGLLFMVVGILLAALDAYRGHAAWPWFVAGGTFFLLTGLFVQPVLKPIYIGWMKFAFVLGWINTRLLLGIFFYLILTPGGLIMRLLGRDALKLKFDRKAGTYWIPRAQQPFERGRYENLF